MRKLHKVKGSTAIAIIAAEMLRIDERRILPIGDVMIHSWSYVVPERSRAISGIAFMSDQHSPTGSLRVRFTSGRIYQADHVSINDAMTLTFSTERGAYFNDHLKDRYQWIEVVKV